MEEFTAMTTYEPIFDIEALDRFKEAIAQIVDAFNRVAEAMAQALKPTIEAATKMIAEAMPLIESAIGTLTEAGNGATVKDLHEAADRLFRVRGILSGEAKLDEQAE